MFRLEDKIFFNALTVVSSPKNRISKKKKNKYSSFYLKLNITLFTVK